MLKVSMCPHLNLSSIFFVLLGLVFIGHAQNNTLTGTGKGIINEPDHETVMVGLTLKQSPEGITGSLSILSETGQDVEKGASFELIQIDFSGNLLKFIVPITGKLDSDSVAFELYLQGKRLQGFGYELREESQRLGVHFSKDE